MKIEKAKIKDLISPEYNPRDITPDEMAKLKTSIEEFGYVDPIIVNDVNMHIVGGNQRYEALKSLGYEEVDVSFIHEPDINREKALNIRLNNSSGVWDTVKLDEILEELKIEHFDISLTGFDLDDVLIDLEDNYPNNETEFVDNNNETEFIDNNTDSNLNNDKYGNISSLTDDYRQENGGNSGVLVETYVVPPFSVFNTNTGYWDKKKKHWQDLIQDNTESRENKLGKLGTSLLDSTLAETIIHWFTPKESDNRNVFDVFAGDTVFGYIASSKKCNFTGIELRQEQADLNNQRVNPINHNSKYICDDGCNVLNHIKENSQDLLFSCPPYFDLEVYSDLPNDASNQETYEDFLKIIETAFTNAIKCLKDNRFAVIVCGDIRDKDGFYYGFPQDIINIFRKNGVKLYNEFILYNKIGYAWVRAQKQFRLRKAVKIHQNVLCFYKGNPQLIKENYYIDGEK